MLDKKPKPRRRRWPFVLLALILLVGTAALALRHYTRPDQLSALLIGQARSTLDADLTLNGTATFAFVPELTASLPHPTLKARGSSTVLLSAEAIRAIVPWHSLWSSHHDIERLEIVKPILDVDALNAWLAARAPSNRPAPDVRFNLRVEDGTLISAGNTIAKGITMAFANSGDLAAWLAHVQLASTAAIPPLQGNLDAKVVQFGDTRLEGIHIEVQGDVAKPTPGKQP